MGGNMKIVPVNEIALCKLRLYFHLTIPTQSLPPFQLGDYHTGAICIKLYRPNFITISNWIDCNCGRECNDAHNWSEYSKKHQVYQIKGGWTQKLSEVLLMAYPNAIFTEHRTC